MRNWIESAVVYQVNLRALAAREPRNAIEAAGGRHAVAPLESPLAYAARHVGRLKRLGVNTLYLMPPYAIGRAGRKGIGSPYAIRDFLAVDPEWGSAAELKDLVGRTHARGMRIIIDITPNHTARDHVWTATHPEYYVRNADGSLFHDFDWSDTAKLDYTRPELCAAMTDVFDTWLGWGVDGFRLDMAHLISDLGFWNTVMPELRRRHAERELLFLAESYGARNNLDLFARGINAAYDDDFYKVCVYGYALDEAGRSCVRLAPEAEANAAFTPLRRAWRAGGIAGAFEHALQVYVKTLPADGGPRLARYTDNHDEGRGVWRFGAEATRAVMTLAFCSPQALPFLLTGQEFGAANRPPIHARLGVCDKGRRVCAGPDSRTEPGIEFEGNLFARTEAERNAWYAFYSELIRLRRQCAALRRGAFMLLDAGEDCAAPERTVVAFERTWRGRTVRCAVNMGPAPRRLRGAGHFEGDTLLGELDGRALPGFGAVVVSR
jgi:glycosidase